MRRKRSLPPPPPTKKRYIISSSSDDETTIYPAVQRVAVVVPDSSSSVSRKKLYGHSNLDRSKNKEAAGPSTSTTELSSKAANDEIIHPTVQRVATVVLDSSFSVSCQKFYGYSNRSRNEETAGPSTSTIEFSSIAANGNKNVPPEIDTNVWTKVTQLKLLQVEFDLTIMRHVRHTRSIRDPRSWQQLLRTRPDLFGAFSPSELQSYCIRLVTEGVNLEFYKAHRGEWHVFIQLARSLLEYLIRYIFYALRTEWSKLGYDCAV